MQGFGVPLVRKFAHSILLCLDLLFRNRLIHCDLKPENVLLKQAGRSGIKVASATCFRNHILACLFFTYWYLITFLKTVLFCSAYETLAYSGITRVGDTRGGNWRCYPMFFLKKATIFFSRRPLQRITFISCRSLQLPPFHIISPVFFLNSAAKFFIRVSPPWMVSPRVVVVVVVVECTD